MSIAPTTATPAAAATPFSGIQSGTILGSRTGAGTFTRTIANQNGARTTDTVFTLANGQKVTRDTTFTQTATGWTRTVTNTLPNGKTTTLQETGTKQPDGSVAVSGTFTDQNGKTQTLSGLDTRHGGRNSSDLTFTNAAGQTRTSDATSVDAGGQALRTVQGTSFGGAAFSNSSALAVLQGQAG